MRAKPRRSWFRAKRFVPNSLLGRSLLIILLPLVLVQGVALQIFYGSHLDLVSRRLSSAVAGEIEQTIELLERFPRPRDQEWVLHSAWRRFSIAMQFDPGARLPHDTHFNMLGPMDDDLAAALREKVRRPYVMDWRSNPQSIIIHIQMHNGMLTVEAPRKRLYSSLFVFMQWMIGTSVLLFTIAALFMRNQVRAIRRLARAAEAFGMGRDRGPIKLEGAVEVRRAASAFNRMQDRIVRFLTQRTEMLAGVSHDLRTPLTRLRLALAMLPVADDAQRAEVAAMTADVDEMDRMIGGYLAFARGEGDEQARWVDLARLLHDIAAGVRRTGSRSGSRSGMEVAVQTPPSLEMRLRPDAIRRAVANLVSNATRHADQVMIAAAEDERNVVVTIDDNGPGIPPDQRESVFRPYESGAVGGTGLGLTIARDIARAHGGDITLESSSMGGLRARLRLPV